MCGIAGISSKTIDKEFEEKCKTMASFLNHRGPDESGFFKDSNNLMFHKRLSIVDLHGGKQPIENENYVLIVNGEIYNDTEIRKENNDYDFKTMSDSESILCVYEKYGIDGFKKLRGMYAFAIYEKKVNKIILGRDQFGIKPLYFHSSKNKFIYSSEIQSLIRSGLIKSDLDTNKIKELLQIQFNTGRETVFNDILRLRPGEILTVVDFNIISSKIFKKFDKEKKFRPTKKNIHDELEKSVLIHQRSDVPYGLFFSGGLDSTLILYFMSLVNSNPINCYSVVFENEKKQKEKLKEITDHFNSNLTCINFNETDFWSLLPEVARVMDDPVIDYAVVPTYKLAQEAKKKLKVILTGEGGDELFGGYGRYKTFTRRFFKKDYFTKGAFTKLEKFNSELLGWNKNIEESKLRLENEDLTELQKIQLFDYNNWLPNDLLIKLDRCLMAHGLEGRTPLIDTELFKNFFLIDDFYKIKGNHGKYFIKDFIKEKINFYNPFHKKKGFTVPVNLWIPKKYKELSQILPKINCLRDLFKEEIIKKLCLNLRNSSKSIIPVWRLVFYALWYITNVDNKKKIEGDTFDVLRQGM